MGPRMTRVSPWGTSRQTSWMTTAPRGPVRFSTSSAAPRSATGSDERRNEIEDCIDHRVGREHADETIHHGTGRRSPDGTGATLRVQPFVRGDDRDHEREDHRLAETDGEVAREKRLAERLDELVRRVAEEDGAADPPTERDERVGEDGEGRQRRQQRQQL